MKLHELRPDFDRCCSFRRRLGDPLLWGDGWFEGTPRGETYPIQRGERDDEENVGGPLPDYTDFMLRPIPTFSERAIEVLGELLSAYGEFTPPIEMDESMHYRAFNPTTLVNGLDEIESEILRFKDGGVMKVERHVLLSSVQILPPIFKMPQTRRNTTYVNEDFVQRAQGLLGFRFPLLFER
jgi:hypothetical protein